MSRHTTDTITASDSTATALAPWDLSCTIEQSPLADNREWHGPKGTLPYMDGIRPAPRTTLPGADSGVMTLFISLFLILALSFRHYPTVIKSFAKDLWDIRNRAGFETHTVSDTRLQISLVLLTCCCEGILLFSTSNILSPLPFPVFTSIIAFIGIAIAYYCLQLMTYSIVGYAFSNRIVTRQWLKGFNASQMLLGFTLVIPAILSVFNPGAAIPALTISVFLYLIARIIFISKGFRLFYDKFGSLLYFILYLCALEIIPLILAYKSLTFANFI